MRKVQTPLVLALVAFVLALVAGGFAYNRVFRTVPALAMLQDQPAGVALTADMVKVIRIPASGLPPQALYGPGQIGGKYAAVPLLAGQILSARQISATPPVADPYTTLTPQQRIISVPVRQELALGGALRPGDRVDVVAAWPAQESKPSTVEVLASAVPIVDLRNSAATSITAAKKDGTGNSAVPTSALLLVNSQQARALVSAVESKASLYLWLAEREQP
ncbi:MAG: Flp pilus assembly protein CpaB [Mycobacterium leprae]